MSEAYMRDAMLAQRVWKFRHEHGSAPNPEQGREIVAEVYQMLASEKRKWQDEAWSDGYMQRFYDRELLHGEVRDASEGRGDNPYESEEA